MARLRAECGWKSAQTHRSLARYLLEETHETLEAIETGSAADLREELGDLLLQVYFHAAIAEESGSFDLEDVAADVVAKMRRRNPHVFGPDGAAASGRPTDPAAVNELWESVKATEKQRSGVLDGIPPTLPALLLADKVLDRLTRADGPTGAWPAFLLLPSPFLGPSSMEPLAAWLRGRGRRATVVRHDASAPGPVVEEVLEAALAHAEGVGPVVLVTHSNAGLYAPLLASRAEVVATVHVDAALPTGAGPTPLAVPALRDLLADRASPDGRLPGWTRWWDAAALAVLAPPAVLAAVEADQPALPAAYLDATIDVPAGWERAPAAYLALGDAYAEERAAAAGHGWPVRTVPGGHLHAVVDPAGVGAAVLALADDLVGPHDLGTRLLGLVAEARATGADPEQALRELARGLAASSQGPQPPRVSPAGP